MNSPIIIYDGYCVYCNGWVKFLLKRKSDYQFTTLQGNTFQEMKTSGVNFPNVDSVILYKNEKVYTQSDAASEILIGLGSGWNLIGHFFLIFPKTFRDAVYAFIARNRYKWFGKYETCSIPDAKDRERFLS